MGYDDWNKARKVSWNIPHSRASLARKRREHNANISIDISRDIFELAVNILLRESKGDADDRI